MMGSQRCFQIKGTNKEAVQMTSRSVYIRKQGDKVLNACTQLQLRFSSKLAKKKKSWKTLSGGTRSENHRTKKNSTTPDQI